MNCARVFLLGLRGERLPWADRTDHGRCYDIGWGISAGAYLSVPLWIAFGLGVGLSAAIWR